MARSSWPGSEPKESPSVTRAAWRAAEGPLCPLPLELSWGGAGRPLPQRPVRLPPRSRRAGVAPVPSWMDTGPTDRPFDFTGHVRRLCADIAARCPELNHVDASRLLVGMTQARSGRSHGLQARLTPLRFAGGLLVRQRRGV